MSSTLLKLTLGLLLGFSCIDLWAAQESPQQFAFEGRLYQVDGVTPLSDVVNFKFQVLNQNVTGNPVNDCVLYEETQSGVNLGATSGVFTLSIGAGTGGSKRTASDAGLTLAQIFDNSKVITAPTGQCPAGSYTPSSGSVRRLRVIVTNTVSGITETLSPDLIIGSVPQAVVAETLQGSGPSDFLRVDGTTAMSEALTFDTWASSGRPSSPAVGSTGFNTTTGYLESWNGSGWVDYSAGSGGGSLSGLTAGRVPFATSTTAVGDDSNLFWDNTNKRLGIGTSTPSAHLDISRSYTAGDAAIRLFDTGTSRGIRITPNASNSYPEVVALGPHLAVGSSATGIFFNSSQIEFKTGGLNQAFIDNSGNLGIATSAGAKLDVSGTNAGGTLRVFDQTATTGVTRSIIRAGAGQTTTNLLEFQNNAGTVTGSVNSSGFWLQPGAPTGATLQAATTTYVDSAVSGASGAAVTKDGLTPLTGDWDVSGGGSRSIKNVAKLAVGTTTLPTTGVATFNGNVGIGTTAPSEKLEISGGRLKITSVPNNTNAIYSSVVYGDASTDHLIGVSAVGNDATLNLGNSGNSKSGLLGLGSSLTGLYGTGTNLTVNAKSTGYINFKQSDGAGTEYMRITSAGNVGIGTTAPSDKVSVIGQVAIDDTDGGARACLRYSGTQLEYANNCESGTPTWNPVGTGSAGNLSVSGAIAMPGTGQNLWMSSDITEGNTLLSGTDPSANTSIIGETAGGWFRVGQYNDWGIFQGQSSIYNEGVFFGQYFSDYINDPLNSSSFASGLYATQDWGTSIYNGGNRVMHSPGWLTEVQFPKTSNDTAGAEIQLLKTRGTTASPTIIQSGDTIGTLAFSGLRAAGALENYMIGSKIMSVSTGAVSGTALPSYLSFFTTANSSTMTEKMRILGNGSVGIGTTSPTTNLDISGTNASGTLRVYDQTATTGVTKSIVRAGAGQSTTNLMEWQNSAGTVLARVDSTGKFVGDGSLLTNVSGSISGLTAGRVPFAASATTIGDDSNLFWDNTNKRLGIGTSTPSGQFQVDYLGSYFRVTQGTTLEVNRADSYNSGGYLLDLTNDDTDNAGRGNGLLIKSGSGSTDYPLRVRNNTASSDFFAVRGDGRVGVNTASPGVALDVNNGSGIAIRGTTGAIDATFQMNGAGVASGNGFNITNWNSTGNTTVSNATSLSFNIDSLNAGGQQFSFTKFGSPLMTILGTGNVGIGTTSPATGFKLDVNGYVLSRGGALFYGENSAAAVGNRVWGAVINTSDGGFYLGNRIDDTPTAGSITYSPFKILPPTVDNTLVLKNGNVGLGTTAPATVLDVNGAFSMREMAAPSVAPSDQGRIYFDQTANKFKVSEHGGAYVDLVGGGGGSSSGTSGHIQLSNGSSGFTSDSNKFFWDATNDRLGIGTNTPSKELQIYGGNPAIALTNSTFTDLRLYADSSGGTIDAGGGALIFNTGSSLGVPNTERMRILSTGNVGIGTTVPTGALHVATAGAASAPGFRADGAWFTGGSTTTTKPQLLIEPSGTTSTNWSVAGTGLGVNATSGFTGNLLDLQVNATSAFKVANNGTLTMSGTGMYSAGQISLHSNGATSRIGNAATAANSALTVHSGNNATGTFLAFETAGSERARIDASGNVGIGTTSPGSILDIKFGTQAHFAFGNTLSAVNGDHYVTFGFNEASNYGQIQAFTHNVGYRNLILNPDGANVGIRTTSPGAMLQLGTAGSTLGTMRMTGNTSGYVQIQPAAAAGSWTMTLPPDAGTSGYVLRTDGNGVTSWVAQSGGGGSPSGTAGAVQFTDGTNFSSNVSNFYWDNANAALGIGSNNPNGNFSKLFVDTTGMVNAVYGRSSLSYGVKGETASAFAGVFGVSTGTGAGVQGASTSGYSGYFRHNVNDGSNTLPTLVVRQATSQTSDTLQVQNSGGTALLRADASGNLSLGSAAPVSKLYIGSAPTASANYGLVNLGGDPFDGSTAGYFGTSSSSSSSGTYLAINAASGYGGDFANFQQAGASRFRLSSNGSITANLGTAQFNYATILTTASIGGANANENLLALTYGNSDTFVVKNTITAANDNYAGMSFYNKRSGATDTKIAAIRGIITDSSAGAYKGALTFMTADNAAPAERMRIDSSGNVGIGTTTPSQKLDVNGAIGLNSRILFSGATSFSNNSTEEFIGSQSSGNLEMAARGSIDFYADTNANDSTTSANFKFFTATPAEGGTAKVVITNAGNVGIGTTNPNKGLLNLYATTNPVLAVQGGGYRKIEFFDTGGNGGSYLGSDNNGANLMQLVQGYNAPLTFSTGSTERLRIDAIGNVGIGTSSPQDKLDVNGNIRVAKNSSQPYACDAAHDGVLALTSGYRHCVCKGGSSTWVFTSDGTTTCTW